MRRKKQYARSVAVSSDKVNLRLDWCSHEAAKFACEHWHYSKKIPVNKLVKIGVWENNIFIGVIIFGVGASATVHKQFNVKPTQCCELVRIALNKHKTPVSRMVAIAIKMLIKVNPKLRVIVSFADSNENHNGGIYQAGNWIYTGNSQPVTEYYYNGDWRHATDVYKRLTSIQIKKLKTRKKPFKYKYVMPLDKDMYNKVILLSKPYPKKCVDSSKVEQVSFQKSEGRAVLTSTLHISKNPSEP